MYNIFGDYIHRKRKSKGLSLRKFGELCGLSHTHIDSIEKGVDFRNNKIVRPTSETVQKIAVALNVSKEIMFALSLEETADNFEFYYDYIERQKIIEENERKLNASSLHAAFRLESARLIMKAHFSESIECCNFNIKHVKFETYAAMLLNQNCWKAKFSDLHDMLSSEYGEMNGLLEGETIYKVDSVIYNTIKQPEKIPLVLEKYNILNAIGKKKANEYIIDLSENPNYVEHEEIRLIADVKKSVPPIQDDEGTVF